VHAKAPGFITTGGDDSATTAAAYNERASLQPRISLALHSYKKGVQIQVYDVPFHAAK
jgi:hypothetical protein